MAELTEAQRIALFKEGDGLLRGTLAYKSGCSLAEDDHRPDNQQAIDLYYETRARLWETLGHLDAHELTHFKAYVRRCAANAWVDHLRERHPMRLSLRNRLLYFVKTHPERFAIDRDEDETLRLRRAQQSRPVSARTDLGALRSQPGARAGLWRPATHWTRLQATDWCQLLDGLVEACGDGLEIEVLTSVLMDLLDVQEEATESLTDAPDEPARDVADELAIDPQDRLVMREAMQKAWQAIRSLKPEHRAALLLNPPTVGARARPGGTLRNRTHGPVARAEVDVFPMLGIASVSEIGRTLNLQSHQYAAAWSALAVAPDERTRLSALPDERERFAALWQHLPMADAIIAKVFDWQNPQQVINRRAQACEQVKRQLVGHRSILRR